MKYILDRNWTGSFTIPAAGQYPHQWSWDAAFIAIGYAHYNPGRARQEMSHLLSGQWAIGMIPHIVFSEQDQSDTYFPGPDFWRTDRSTAAPSQPKTSSICQPPVHATAVRHILEQGTDRKKGLAFAKEVYPGLVKWHNYLRRERDPRGEGLVYIRHPWESGQDNSPAWDPVLKRIQPDPGDLPDYERRDTVAVDAAERPTKRDYDRYVYLVDFFGKRAYDENRIRRDGAPFMVQDVLFNTLYCKANRDLAVIAELLGEDPRPHRKQARKTAESINQKMWDQEHGMYITYDMHAEQQIHAHILSGFLPMLAGIPDATRAKRMCEYLNTHCFCRLDDACLAAPSYDRSGPGFSVSKYWRGPVWINMNWRLCPGLDRYGYTGYADRIRRSILQLSNREGFREYFDPDDGRGYGAEGFSW
ncbi:MAG: trehalase family glycosidase [Balneolaceae bacterium]|nr:trehalase family glycosidase [Balneolaceae bacterium]